MPRLKDRNKQTPGGHQFYDPVLKYRARPWASIDEIASGLIQARLANPALTQQHGWSTDETTVRNEVDAAIARHCQQMGWRNFIVDDSPGGGQASPSNFPQQRPQNQRFLGKLRNAAVSGSPVIVDFITSKEEAVPVKLATARAEICLKCPYNQKTKSFVDIFATSVSEAVRKGMEKLRGWNLDVPNSKDLSVCAVCSCPLRLKIFVPIHKIRAKLPEDIKSELPEYCWLLTEP